jgi:hypothetical protein
VTNPLALGLKISQGERPRITSDIPPAFAKLIERCWAGEAPERPDFESIVVSLSSDDFLIPGADQNEVNSYRLKVFPQQPINRDNPLARQKAELEQLQAEHQIAVTALRQEISALQDENCKLCTLYRKLVSKAQSLERAAAEHDQQLVDIGVRVEGATTEMDELKVAYDGPLRVQLEEDAARMEAAFVGTDGVSVRKGRASDRRTEGVFATVALAIGSEDICGAGIVGITGSSKSEEDQISISRIADASWDGIWHSVDRGFVEFDFRGRAIALTGYAIRVAQSGERSDLRYWIVEGYKDGNWLEIDRKEGDERIGPGITWVTFPCGKGRGRAEFGKIRIVQTGPASGGEGIGFGLTNVEFFGVLKNDNGE